jgi:DNA ligase (NAD+)
MVNNYTKVIDIRQDIGMLGKVSFTAILEPITINDKVIRHASLGSYERAKGLNLAKGDIVNIKYEIVPYLCTDSYTEKHRSGESPIELISECPYCHNDLEMNPELSCVNPNCPSRIQGKINNFCIRLNIEGIGPKMIEELFSVGFITSIESLFDIKYREKEFCALDGYGKKTWRKLVKQISNLKITEPDLLACVSISGIGPKKAKDISNIYHIDEILSIAKEPHGKRIFRQRLTPHLASVLYEGVNSNRTLIEFLLGHVKVIKPVKDNFAGIIVFTVFRNPAFQKHLQSLGYEVADSVTKKTNLVIMAGDEVTGKIKRASELGIPIIEVNEAYEKFNFKI